jgi:hypothetical protein
MSYDIKISGGDLAIQNSDLKKVFDSEKLIQDILKICLTTAGTNKFNPWYGSFLSKTIIGNPMDMPMIVQISKSQLNSSLENLKNLQEEQVRTFQYVSQDEQIAGILNISIVRNQSDPRLFDISIQAVSKGMKPVTTAFRVTTI